ncbi:MAG: hypothetical protein IH861_09640 [Chloroflexi bacterium]|nr:hypothetical protein [Chloroflexota bacterium]
MSQRMLFAMIFPILAVLTIAIFAGGLGVIFMVINSTPIHETGVIILGLCILVFVPLGAYFIQRAIEK